MVRPRAFAVFRLITSSNFVGCSMGRSEGFAPFRILSTYVAARRSKSERLTPYSTRFHEGDELIAPGLKKDVADASTFLDFDDVAAHRFEPKDIFVEVTRLVEI